MVEVVVTISGLVECLYSGFPSHDPTYKSRRDSDCVLWTVDVDFEYFHIEVVGVCNIDYSCQKIHITNM